MSDIEKLMHEAAEEEALETRSTRASERANDADLSVKQILADAADEVDRQDYLDRAEETSKSRLSDEYADDGYEDDISTPKKSNIEDSRKEAPSKKKRFDESSSDEESVGGGDYSDTDTQIQLCCYHGDASALDRILSKVKDAQVLMHRDQHVSLCICIEK